MADTIDFEGQSYEEAEELKKEYSVFLNRIQEAKRKFTLQDTEKRLQNLNNRLRDMILQANPDLCLDMPPQPPLNEATTQAGTRIQAHLTYLESSLEAMDSARTKALQTVEKNIYDANEGLEDLNLQLYTILGTSNVKRLPTIPPLLSSSDENLQARIAYLGVGLDHIEQQIKRSTEEKSILSIQIQQQRELKTKSDSERDTRISSLTQELTKAKKSLTAAQEEARSRSEELVLITEQLNYVRQDAVREEQRYGSSNGIAEKATNEKLTAELKLKQDRITTLENEAATQSKELKDLEGQVVRAQTELTVVRAELDGSRAQRAADISANPANQKEIDRLNKRNAELRKELERLKTQPETPVPAETTSTMVLKNEFRKMMRDTRAENIKALRVSLSPPGLLR